MNLFKKQWFAILILVFAIAGGIALGLFRYDRDVEEAGKQSTNSVTVSVDDTKTDVNVNVPNTDTEVKVDVNNEPNQDINEDFDDKKDNGKFHLSKWKVILILFVLYCIFQGRKKN